jgi:signal transduction histidine kinase
MWFAAGAAVLVLTTAIALRFTDVHDPVSTLRPNYDGHRTGVVWEIGFGALWLASGLFAWRRRPDNRVGPLMMAVGFAVIAPWALVGFGRIGFGVAALVDELAFAIGAHLFLAFPTGRLNTRLERAVVAVMYVDATVIQAGALFLRDFSTANCELCPTNALMIASQPELANALVTMTRAVAIASGFAIVLMLAWRWRNASPPARRIVAPVLWSSVLVAAVLAARFFQSPYGYDDWPVIDWAGYSVALVPLAFLLGVFRMRLQRSAVGDLVVELGRPHRPAELRDMLARALGDPSLELLFWLADPGRYVDADGHPVQPAPGRGVAVIEHDGVRLGALVYDPSLQEDPALVESVGAAARLAMHNSRLQAELRAQLLVVRDSRARVVSAADAERRRIERNLHDGAQQRLLALRLAVRFAGRSEQRKELEEQLAAIDAELADTLEELRALARGLHPPILTEQGLSAALETLARRAALPVRVTATPAERLPETLESAAYYVAAEGLANAVKHARASSVTIAVARDHDHVIVEITDDGRGGASLAGSGLRGLRDRVEALDGTLTIVSATSAGTSVRAELPCA